jgi:hypothetical protein
MSNQPPYLPTDMGITNTVLLLSNNVSSGPYAFWLPQCNVSSNRGSGTIPTKRVPTMARWRFRELDELIHVLMGGE